MPHTSPRCIHVVDAVVLPRFSEPYGMIDHGSEGVCVIRLEDAQGETLRTLAWRKGSMEPNAGVRGFGRSYVPAKLVIMDSKGHTGAYLHDGGRLTRSILESLSSRLDGEFGSEAVALARPGRTVIVRMSP
jgi:hypothetical protein